MNIPTENPLALWLRYLGIPATALSARLGLHPTAIGLAAARGSRRCAWLREAELLLAVPARVLVAIPPDDPRCGPWRARALALAADWRMRNRQ